MCKYRICKQSMNKEGIEAAHAALLKTVFCASDACHVDNCHSRRLGKTGLAYIIGNDANRTADSSQGVIVH